ncbi:hypothetical protein DICVIV_11649 [Dictyocaulus viviparus]|uniref:Membrane protein BRI3 n=1 Tax=Dictyocaulus viviparus TaxID=29172 RepID=A0A0D8XF47_DICVI|nr:hypothetical protein DICVIV_11649 [Dictyocaulus viviparus]
MSHEKNSDLPKMTVNDVPTAPPISHEERQTMSNEDSPNSRNRESQGVHSTSHANQRNFAGESSSFDVPPPSYQMAINCPTTPYPTGDMPIVPPSMTSYAGHPPKPYPAIPVRPPIYNAIQIGASQNPQPQPQPVASTQVVVTVGNGLMCPHCNVGVITKETDMCCMLCLILLTIFTFPLGLVFLCCLPCTISRRCSNCRRSV